MARIFDTNFFIQIKLLFQKKHQKCLEDKKKSPYFANEYWQIVIRDAYIK
jgi:hypothetical protein